jgi:hypothetical protein
MPVGLLGGSRPGVVRADGSLTPSWFTYATLIRRLDSVTQRAVKVPLTDNNVRLYVWKRAGKPIVTAWAIDGTVRLDMPLGRCTVTDAFGAAATMDVRRGLELSEFPLYISDFADPAVVKRLEAEAQKTAVK